MDDNTKQELKKIVRETLHEQTQHFKQDIQHTVQTVVYGIVSKIMKDDEIEPLDIKPGFQQTQQRKLQENTQKTKQGGQILPHWEQVLDDIT